MWICYYSLYTSDQYRKHHCLRSSVVPQLRVTLTLLSSSMHVTPSLLPVSRCWWDGSLRGPAAALDMPLIYNAQLWQRNQRCLYAKPSGAQAWWEKRSVTLTLFLADTRLALWLYLNDTYRGMHICWCNGGCWTSGISQSWWTLMKWNNDM